MKMRPTSWMKVGESADAVMRLKVPEGAIYRIDVGATSQFVFAPNSANTPQPMELDPCPQSQDTESK